MRPRIARILRRWANRVDPPAPPRTRYDWEQSYSTLGQKPNPRAAEIMKRTYRSAKEKP